METTIEVIPSRDIGEDTAAILQEWSDNLFGDSGAACEWSEPDWHVLVRCDGELTTSLTITERTVSVGGQSVTVAGVGSVMTPREWQGRALAKAAMRKATEFMADQLHVQFGFLVCSERLVPYYDRLGWQLVLDTVTFDQPTGKTTWPEEAMILPRSDIPWPQGPVDLQGKPW